MSQGASLLILDRVAPADAASPEMRYLRSLLGVQAERVFTRVRYLEVPEEAGQVDLPSLGECSAVLLIGGDNIYLGARSLESMKRRLDAGAPVVVPSPLSDFRPPENSDPIYGLRGFEAVEERLIGSSPLRSPEGHLPISLWRASALSPLLEAHGDALLAAETDVALPDGSCSGGIYHAFVDYYGQARDDVLAFLPKAVSSVLEVGCGRGLTGALIKRALGCRVTGVELNVEAAAEARSRLDEVITGDVIDIHFDQTFDAVVATELIEHLPYPEPFLERLHTLLAPGGRAVFSIPNVGHWSVVGDLLAGRFDYLPIGLLCYTHFRFFTETTLRDWSHRAGFPAPRIVPQRTELPERFRDLGAAFEIDRDSLSTKGFYLILERPEKA